MKKFSELRTALSLVDYYNKDYRLKNFVYNVDFTSNPSFEKTYSQLDIYKLTFLYKKFPTVLIPTDRKSMVVSCSKNIPKNVKNKFRFLPRNTVCMTFIDGDCVLKLAITQDNYNRILILDTDKRFCKKAINLPESNKKDLIFNIRCYFEILNYFLHNDYLEYERDGMTIYIPLDHDSIKNMFKKRDTIGRRSPILYGVDSFTRTYKNVNTNVKAHLRGISEVSQDGAKFKIIAGAETVKKYMN